MTSSVSKRMCDHLPLPVMIDCVRRQFCRYVGYMQFKEEEEENRVGISVTGCVIMYAISVFFRAQQIYRSLLRKFLYCLFMMNNDEPFIICIHKTSI